MAQHEEGVVAGPVGAAVRAFDYPPRTRRFVTRLIRSIRLIPTKRLADVGGVVLGLMISIVRSWRDSQ